MQILEVNRTRAKQFGLDLGDYSITGIFSPEVSADDLDRPTAASVTNVPPFNLNTISRGISAADFYLAVPTAVIRFLETDSQTKLMAKPQLRGQEGQKITLNLGDDFPVPEHDVRIARRRRQRRDAADLLVHLSAGRHHRQRDAARDLRWRHRFSS